MTLVHRLAAYDRTTDHLVTQVDLSEAELATLIAVARVPARYQTTFGSFPIDPSAIRNVGAHSELPDQNVDWFLEVSAGTPETVEGVRDKAASDVSA